MKGRIVAESYAAGTVVSEVARRHEISPQHLFAWRKAARAGLLSLPADEVALFVPVVTPPHQDGATAAVADGSGSISRSAVWWFVRHAVSTRRGCGMFCEP